MFAEDGMRSRSHGLDYKILEAQAKALSMPLITCNASWGDYEKKFVKQLNRFKNEGMGAGVFGDIDLEPHRSWVEGVCKQAGIKPYLPLWKRGRQELLDEFLAFGFSAIIIAVKDDILDNSFLGRNLDKQTIVDLENAGVDASGEEGEYHTMVTAGPIFSAPLAIRRGDIIMSDGYWFLDISLV